MPNLLDLMHEPPIRRPIIPDGSVVQHDVDELLEMASGEARIELHQYNDGLWMWSTSFQFKEHGHGYRVGPKWGNFAKNRNSALHWAVHELSEHINEHPEDKCARKAASWVRRLI